MRTSTKRGPVRVMCVIYHKSLEMSSPPDLLLSQTRNYLLATTNISDWNKLSLSHRISAIDYLRYSWANLFLD